MNTFPFYLSPPGKNSYEIPSAMAARYAILPQGFTKNYNKFFSGTFSPIPKPESGIQAPIRRKYKKHPSIAKMIDEAIYENSARGKGLSLVAVKKFLSEKYNFDVKHSAKRIREYIKQSLQSGRFIQMTGRGANGSYRLASDVRSSLNRKKRESQTPNRESDKSKRNLSIQISRKRKADLLDPSVATPKKKKQNTTPVMRKKHG